MNVIKKINRNHTLKTIALKIMAVFIVLFGSSTALAAHAVLFVSLGMPDNALVAYFKQAKHDHIPLVIRGLYTNPYHHGPFDPMIGSFRDTAHRVKALLKKSNVGGVSIDPLLFRAFGIWSVPALVIYDDALSCVADMNTAPAVACRDDQFDVVYGNVPLKKLLSIVVYRSSSASRAHCAQSLLDHSKKAGERA